MKMSSYQNRITLKKFKGPLEVGEHSKNPCIRNLCITVHDVLLCLAEGKRQDEILEEYPELEAEDITACLYFAAAREKQLLLSGELIAYSILGVVLAWLLIIGLLYLIFLLNQLIFQEPIYETFLQIMYFPGVWIVIAGTPFLGLTKVGIEIGLRKKLVSEDLKQIISQAVAMSMITLVIIFVIIWLIFFGRA